jgi:carotenoid cleavage dioxygenase
MPRFLPVPWIRWQRYRVTGVVREEGTQRPLEGLRVAAFDQDVVKDDFLGEAMTDAEGCFEIHFTDADFKDLLESKPDIYLCVFRPDQPSEAIADTSWDVRANASPEEAFEIEIAPSSLA